MFSNLCLVSFTILFDVWLFLGYPNANEIRALSPDILVFEKKKFARFQKENSNCQEKFDLIAQKKIYDLFLIDLLE